MICDRCGNNTGLYTGSMFNTETICMPCKDTETQHPLYERARRVELAAVQNGYYNFPGIGLPDDLKQ